MGVAVPLFLMASYLVTGSSAKNCLVSSIMLALAQFTAAKQAITKADFIG
jgi:hypothetical protein